MTTRLGDWGVLTLLGPEDAVPQGLLAIRSLWEDDPRRVPALLTLRRGGQTHPYVVCWPADAPPPDLRGEPDLDGIAIGEAAVLRCFACDAEHDAIYPDGGLPGFGVVRHRLASGCPTCGADVATSRITALAIGEGRFRYAVPPGGGARPPLLALALVAWLFVALMLGFGIGSGTASYALGVAVIGLVLLSPPVLAMYTEHAFRWIVGAYAVVTVLGLLAGGVILLPSVLVMVFAAIEPPPPRGWRVGRALAAFCVAGGLLFLLGLLMLALARPSLHA